MSAVATVADHTPKADNRSSDDRWHPTGCRGRSIAYTGMSIPRTRPWLCSSAASGSSVIPRFRTRRRSPHRRLVRSATGDLSTRCPRGWRRTQASRRTRRLGVRDLISNHLVGIDCKALLDVLELRIPQDLPLPFAVGVDFDALREVRSGFLGSDNHLGACRGPHE